MPTVKKISTGKPFTVDQQTVDQIKANPSLAQNYTFGREQAGAPTPPEAQEGTVKKDEGQQQQSSPISAPPQQQPEQAPQQETKAAGKNSKK